MNDALPRSPASRSIVLCGFMGSGKSTVGRRVARALSRPFYDCDEEIERRLGRSIPALFERGEEERFRATEASVVTELVRGSAAAVISLGGGALENTATADLVLNEAVAVHLDRPFAAILASLGRLRVHRPLLAGRSDEEIAALYQSRLATYRRCPISISTGDLGVAAVAEAVVTALAAHGATS